MKLFLLIIAATLCYANTFACTYKVGDEYSVKSKSNIRESPSTASKILCTIDYEIVSWLEIQNSITSNGFVKVKFVADSNSYQFQYNGTIGWISESLIEYVDYSYSMTDQTPEYYTKGIQKQEELKRINDCKYSADTHAELLSLRGQSYFGIGNYFSAITDFTTSINTSPTYKFIFDNYYYRAQSKQRLADYNGAISDYTYCITNCGKQNDDQTCVCGACSQYNNVVVKLRGINYPGVCKEQLLTQRSICYVQLKKYQLALSDLNSAITIDPNYGYAYYLRGQVKDLLNDSDGCCSDLSKAGELGIKEAYTEIDKRCNN